MSEARPNHVPERTCVACRKKRPQGELLRFGKDANGTWQMDWFPLNRKRMRSGRGVYLCADNPACAVEKKLRRTFGTQAEPVALQVAAYHHHQELESGTATSGVTG